MPVMGGVEMLEKIKANEALFNIPVIIVSTEFDIVLSSLFLWHYGTMALSHFLSYSLSLLFTFSLSHLFSFSLFHAKHSYIL